MRSGGADGWCEQQDPYSSRRDVELALQGDPFDQRGPLYAVVADWQELDQCQPGFGEVIVIGLEEVSTRNGSPASVSVMTREKRWSVCAAASPNPGAYGCRSRPP